MLILDAKQVEERLSAARCCEIMEECLKAERDGRCVQYLRTAIQMPNTNILGIMPGFFHSGYFGAKVLSVYHTNGAKGYPSHQGSILLFKEEHGELLAVIDATSVTRVRTGCVSAVASTALARPDSSRLAILGCGQQGRSHLEAIAERFKLEAFSCWDVFPQAAERLAAHAAELGIARAEACATVEEAVRDADIICTVTPAKEPILKAEWVKPGAHINAVGACAPAARELDSALAARARFFCDNVESIEHESGDYLIPLKEGLYGPEHLLGAVGDVLLGRLPGRLSAEDITVFDAVGMAVEDIACAVALYEGENDQGR